MNLPKILTNKPKKITRAEARKALRNGTWKSDFSVDIIGGCNGK